MIGSFDNNGCPVIEVIEVEVSGPVHNPRKITAMVDTGFSGFLLMPILEAFPVGLILRGTMDIVLADGSNQTKLTCLGQVTLESETQIGLIIIEPQNAQVLVGMDFLKKI